VFHLHHGYYSDCFLAKWQLSKPAYLTPMSYNTAWKFDPATRQMSQANLTTDTMCHYNTPVVDTWHLGFGEMCFVCDQVVLAINQMLNNQTVSNGALHKSLSKKIRLKSSKTMNPLNTVFTERAIDASECNPQCNPMPYPPSYLSDANNRRQLEKMTNNWGLNLGAPMQLSDVIINVLITLFNKSGFCSAYATAPTNTTGVMGALNAMMGNEPMGATGAAQDKKTHKKRKKTNKRNKKKSYKEIIDGLMKEYSVYFKSLVKSL
jgi:hypothetical protein